MMLRLQNYQFDMVFQSTSEVIIADTLSRAFPLKNRAQSPSESFSEDVAELQESSICYLAASDSTIRIIREAAIHDEIYELLKNQILKGWPNSPTQLPDDLKEYFPYCDELTIEDDLIYKGERLFVPHGARREIIERSHASHLGRNGCLNRAKAAVFFPGMHAAITKFVSQCRVCATFQNEQSKEPLQSHEIVTRPWEKIACDLFHHNGQDYLITIDYFSNFMEIDRLSNKKSSEVIYNLKKQFSRNGLVSVLFSDNGPPFNSAEFEDFARKYEFEHRTSSPYFPQSNGKIERCIKSIKNILTKAKEDNRDPFLALLDFRNTPTQHFEESPAQRFFGRPTRTLLPIKDSLFPVPGRSKNINSTKRAQQTQAFYYNRSAHTKPQLNLNQTVRIKLNSESDWVKGQVVEILPFRSYNVKTENGRIYRRNRRHIRFSNEPPVEDYNTDDADDSPPYPSSPRDE